MERLEVGQLLPHAGELDRLAGDGGGGERRAAPGVAVELRDDDAGERNGLGEGLRRDQGVLAGHGVEDEQDLMRLGDGVDPRHLVHHLGIDVQPAGGVEDDDIRVPPALLQRPLDNGHRIRLAHLGVGRALQVGRHEQRPLALATKQGGELGGGRGLAGALEAGEHDDRWGLRGGGKPDGLAAEHPDELLVDDLDHLLAGGERLEHLLAKGLGFHVLKEGAHRREGHVRLEEGHPDLPQRLVDLLLGQPPARAELAEDVVEAVAEGVEHAAILRGRH